MFFHLVHVVFPRFADNISPTDTQQRQATGDALGITGNWRSKPKV